MSGFSQLDDKNIILGLIEPTFIVPSTTLFESQEITGHSSRALTASPEYPG